MRICERKSVQNLDDPDTVTVLLDGSQVDDGTAWEIGYFYSGHDRPTRPQYFSTIDNYNSQVKFWRRNSVESVDGT